MRKKIVAGNWKMNMTPKEAVGLVNKLRDKLAGSDVEVVFCVPAIDIIPVVEAVKDTDIKVGAENMHYEEKGAFTGEISPGMLVDSGVSYVILGHSERRQYFGEDDDCINRKVRKAIEYGITPIINENKQIIHGIFDVLCINEDKITIIDYKTDTLAKNSSDELLKELHQGQMYYYKKIMKQMFPNKEVEAIVYYLYIHRYVTL